MNKLKFLFLAMGLGVLVVVIGSCITGKSYDPYPTDPPAYQVIGLTASYTPATDTTNDTIIVTWGAPSLGENQQVVRYYVYRTWNKQEDLRDSVDHPAMTFGERPAVGSGSHSYSVAALLVDTTTGVVFRGQKSLPCTAEVKASGGIMMLNKGAAYTATDTVEINLRPISNILDYTIDTMDSLVYTIDTSGDTTNTDTVRHLEIIEQYTPAEILELYSFDTARADADTPTVARVRLSQGPGVKEVKVLTTTTVGTQPLTRFIRIQPYTIKIKIQNSDLSKRLDGQFKVTEQKKVQFTVEGFDDSTMYSKAHFWIAVASGGGKTPNLTDNTKYDLKKPGKAAGLAWIETAPREFSVDWKNEDVMYEYDLTDTIKSCNSMVRTFPLSLGDLPKQPGAYWGLDPMAGGVRFTNYSLKDSIFYLSPGMQASHGLKDFIVIGRFVGKYFNDERYVTSYFSKTSIARWDFYPPSIHFDTQIRDTPQEGDTVSTAFNVRLNTGNGAVQDIGRCKPSMIRLYFARVRFDAYGDQEHQDRLLRDIGSLEKLTAYKYPGTNLTMWNYFNGFKTKQDTLNYLEAAKYWGSSYMLKDILTSKWIKFDYEFVTNTYYVGGVRWVDLIDPTTEPQWESGWYIMAITTKDKCGNEGLAATRFGADPKYDSNDFNPRIFYIQTGK